MKELGKKIIESKYDLAKKIDEVRVQHGENPPVLTDFVKELRGELFTYFGEALYEDFKTSEERFIKWGRKNGELAVEYEVPLDTALNSTRFYRIVLWDFIETRLTMKSFQPILF